MPIQVNCLKAVCFPLLFFVMLSCNTNLSEKQGNNNHVIRALNAAEINQDDRTVAIIGATIYVNF